MSTFRSPVGPQSPRVYWRRRLLLGLGVIAVIVIIILIVSRPGPIAPGTKAGSASSSSASPAPTVAPQANGAACLPANVTVTAVTDKDTYGVDEKPLVSMKITNIGKKSCSINVGSSQQELIITSGSEKIWDSKDCQSAPVDLPYTLLPATPAPTQTTAWDRTRSSTTTCAASRLPVSAAGASYHLQVKLGTLVSKKTAQFILN